MLDIDIAYPEFVPNQILTDGQLNQLRLHLEQEDRLTRVRLAGMGIVCGLTARKTTSIEIDAGYGVTSDGDLIELCPKTTYTHFRPYADPDKDEEGQLRYLPWRAGTPTAQRDIIELITQAQMEVAAPELPPEGATPWLAQHLANTGVDSKIAGRVLVLYLEHEPEELKSCLVTSCDNKGRNINVNVRALLVRSADLVAAAAPPPPPVMHQIRRPYLPKGRNAFGHRVPLTTAQEINDAFDAVVSGNVTAVGASIRTLFDTYGPFLNLPVFAANPLAGKLIGGAAQYRYDALLDFAAAYYEAAAAAYALVTVCCPEGTFPRHLMLGVLDGSDLTGFPGAPARRNRHEFYPSPLRNVMHGEIERVRELFKRLERMVFSLNLGEALITTAVRPSHTAAYPLGRRAKPFYFGPSASQWRPRARGTIDIDWPRPARVELDFPTTMVYPSDFTNDYAECTLIRIEGTANRNFPTSVAQVLENQRNLANVEFHVLCSYLDDGYAAEQAAQETLVAGLTSAPIPPLAARAALESWIQFGKGEIDPIVAFSRQRTDLLTGVQEKRLAWLNLRNRRRLHCDTSALAHDYFQARSEFVCAVNRARGAVARVLLDVEALPDEALIGPGLEAMLDGVPAVLVDHLVGAIVAMPLKWDSGVKVEAFLVPLGRVAGSPAVRAALRFALENLDTHLQMVVQLSLLPQRVADFNFDLFACFFRLALAQSRELWHWTRALGVRIPGLDTKLHAGRDVPLHPAEETSFAADWLGLQGCSLARLATMFAEYESIRANDLSLFRNLDEVAGLEHIAGVVKGGTFVLVCDEPSFNGTVVADFSLDGCLPCCCAFDAQAVCLPPIAPPDVRVVTLPRDGKWADLVLEINVRANDSNLNVPGMIEVKPISDRSHLQSQLGDAGGGRIRYQISNKVKAGMVDRFEYRLETTGDKCAGLAATGTVVIVFAAEPVIDGAIEGVVVDENNKPVGLTTVTIIELAREFEATDNGRFAFMDVAPGNYRLVARTHDGSGTSDEEEVAVVSGETTRDVRLMLRKAVVTAPERPGRIFVTVRDETHGVLPGVRVTALRAPDPQRDVLTNSSGVGAFLNLKAGTYTIVAEMPGAVTQQHDQPVVLGPDQTVAIDMVLRTRVVVVPPRVIETVAGRRNVDVLTAGTEIRVSLQERYTSFADTYNKATRDPKIVDSDAYKSGAAFLAKQITDPGATDAEVSAQYKRTATTLAAAVTAAPAAADKAAFRTALVAVTAAYFDRVAATTPDTLAADQTAEVKAAMTRLRNAGITADAFKEQWQGTALKERAGLTSADAIGSLIG